MKNLITLGLLTSLTGISFGQDYWVQRDSINGPERSASMAFELNGEAFIIGGVDFFEFKRTMYSYDLADDDWDDELKLGGESGTGLSRASGVASSSNGKAYVGLGGGSVEYFKDFWEYDPEAETWTQVADFGGTGRREAIAFTLDSTIYVGTGQDAGGLKNDFWKYEPYSNSWTQLNDFSGQARRDAVGYRMGGKGYVGTGVSATGYLTDFWEYDPFTDSWSAKSDFPGTPRHGAVGFGVFPNAYIALGEDNAFNYKKDVWEYNYFGDIWTQKTDFIGAERSQAVAIVVDNRIFVGAGYNGIYYDDFYEYVYVLATPESTLESIVISPNPTLGQFHLNVATEEAITVNLYSIDGKLMQRHENLFPNNEKLSFDITSFEPGIYLVESIIGNEKIIRKISLQR